MATTTEELKINITVNAEEAERKLEALRSKITEIAALSEKGNFQHLGDLAKSIKAMAGSADKLSTVAQNLKDITDRASAFSKSLSGIKDSKDAFAGMSKSLKSAKSALEDAEAVSSKGKGMFSNLGTMSIEDAAGSIVSDFKRIGSAGAKLAQLPFKMLFTPIQGLATRVASLTQGFGHLFHTIGRVAFMRAIRGAIRMVTQALKEGVGAVYDWAGAVGNSFVGTMNSISTSLTYFRNSVGASISPILDAIAPVLDGIVDKCVTVINAFNQMIATLTGASTWRKAEKVATSFGGATNNAAKGANNANKAAKELKRTLLGFDEINRLDAPDSGSGSGGSGGGGGGGSSGAGALTFSRQPISDAVENFADMLKDAWDKGDFTEVGDLIGQKIGDALLSVPWDTKIKPAVSKLATSFGTLLNGMFDYTGSGGKKMWDGIAYTAYSALNTVMLGYVTFFKTVNWNGIGQGVGAALKKGLTNGIEWNLVSQALSAFPNAVIDAIDGFCSQFKMSDFTKAGQNIGKAVADAIINIKWDTLFSDGVRIAQGILRAINGALESFGEKWGEIKSGIVNGIKKIPAARWGDVGYQIGRLLVNAAKFIANIVDTVVQALEAANWDSIISGIGRGISEVDWGKAAKSVGSWIAEHLGTVSILLSLSVGKIALTMGVTVLKNMVKTAIAGKLGGAATGGLSCSGWGAFLTLTATASLLMEFGLVISDVKNQNWAAFAKRLGGGLAGALVGFSFGGPVGAMLGFSIGAELTVNFTKIIPKIVSGADNFLFGWLDKIQGNDRSTYTHGIDDDTLNAWGGPLASVNQQTVTNKQDRRYGAPNKVTYGSDTVTKAQTFQVMPDTSDSDKWWKNVQTAWDRIVSAHKASRFHVAGVVNEAQEWWTQTRTFWENKVSSGATKASRFHVTGVVNESAEWWNQVRTFWSNNVEGGQKASRFHIAGVVNEAGAWWNQTKSFWNNATSGSKLYVSVGISGAYNAFVNAWNNMQRNFNNNILTAYVQVKKIGGSANATYTADGGIYKNGHWQDITRYAAGGTPMSGEIFIAREAGPELVGTIGGDTAVMNNDQIVSSVSAGVARAVAGVMGQSNTPIDVTVKIDSEVLYRAVKRGERVANGRYGTVVAIG